MNPDVNSQSTDRLRDDTNRFTARVLARGTFTIDCTTPQTVGYSGSGSVTVAAYSIDSFIPMAEVWSGSTGGGTTAYSKCPYTLVDDNGQVSSSVYFDVRTADDNLSVKILAVAYNQSPAVYTLCYNILSMETGPTIAGLPFS